MCLVINYMVSETKINHAAYDQYVTGENLQFQNDCYAYMAAFAKTIYENEERRESSLIQQASQMQTAFSFVIAAVFMVAAIVVENHDPLSLDFLLLCFSTITIALLTSLVAATIAQSRYKRDDFPQVATMKMRVITEFENFKTEAQRSKYLLDTYEIMHKSYEETNEKRRKWVVVSMNSFYIALALCALWFFVGICKIL